MLRRNPQRGPGWSLSGEREPEGPSGPCPASASPRAREGEPPPRRHRVTRTLSAPSSRSFGRFPVGPPSPCRALFPAYQTHAARETKSAGPERAARYSGRSGGELLIMCASRVGASWGSGLREAPPRGALSKGRASQAPPPPSCQQSSRGAREIARGTRGGEGGRAESGSDAPSGAGQGCQ